MYVCLCLTLTVLHARSYNGLSTFFANAMSKQPGRTKKILLVDQSK
jgi:hypothetical protein